MGVLETLTLAMGTAWASGINLYATIAALGLAGRFQLIQLPQNLEVLTDPLVIGVAATMYVIEFFIDKVPYVDNAWDALHTFIRVPAGAILAGQAVGNVAPALELAAILAGGAIALTAHGTKATARLALNASPEPVSNTIASFTEDLSVLGGIWLTFNHPIVMLLLLICFIAFAAWMIPTFFRLARRGFRALRAKFHRNGPTPQTP